jgi:hypothetical protein
MVTEYFLPPGLSSLDVCRISVDLSGQRSLRSNRQDLQQASQFLHPVVDAGHIAIALISRRWVFDLLMAQEILIKGTIISAVFDKAVHEVDALLVTLNHKLTAMAKNECSMRNDSNGVRQ